MSNYRKILEYRSHLKGLAILWVVFFHLPITISNTVLKFIWEIGYGGVDIFFFLSGIGVYYSLKKHSTEEFYLRRVKRIMPAYLPVVLVTFCLYNYFHWQGISFHGMVDWMKQLTGNIFMTGWFAKANGQFNWYVQAVMWFYLIAPLLLYVIRRVSKDKWKVIGFWLIILLAQVAFFDTALHKMPARLLVFVLGMWAAFVYEEGKREKENLCLLYVSMAVGIAILFGTYCLVPDWLSMYGLFWYPFVLIVPGLCVLWANVFGAMQKSKGTRLLINGIRCLGDASFEIYLIHILLFEFLLKPVGISGNGQWFVAAVLAVLAGILYKKAIACAKSKLQLA